MRVVSFNLMKIERYTNFQRFVFSFLVTFNSIMIVIDIPYSLVLKGSQEEIQLAPLISL